MNKLPLLKAQWPKKKLDDQIRHQLGILLYNFDVFYYSELGDELTYGSFGDCLEEFSFSE